MDGGGLGVALDDLGCFSQEGFIHCHMRLIGFAQQALHICQALVVV